MVERVVINVHVTAKILRFVVLGGHNTSTRRTNSMQGGVPIYLAGTIRRTATISCWRTAQRRVTGQLSSL